jgi:hypothetical protein
VLRLSGAESRLPESATGRYLPHTAGSLQAAGSRPTVVSFLSKGPALITTKPRTRESLDPGHCVLRMPVNDELPASEMPSWSGADMGAQMPPVAGGDCAGRGQNGESKRAQDHHESRYGTSTGLGVHLVGVRQVADLVPDSVVARWVSHWFTNVFQSPELLRLGR